MLGPHSRPPARVLLLLALAPTCALASDSSQPKQAAPPRRESVLIAAAFYDGYASGDADEAVQLWNTGSDAAAIGGWWIDDGRGTAGFPADAMVAAGSYLWLARDSAAFARSFGHPPDWSWGNDSAGGSIAPRLVSTGGGPVLANVGDVVWLRSSDGQIVDCLSYGEQPLAAGWSGPPVEPYHFGAISGAHQVLYRKLDPRSGLPLPDTDTARDWASDAADPVAGRRARFPGWDLEANLLPRQVNEVSRMEVAIAPDALYEFLRRHLGSATTSIDMAVYTFANPGLAEVLAARAAAGVRVRLLVDGSPAGGIELDQRWALATIDAAGGEVLWMDHGGRVRRRYRGMHSKMALVDGRTLLLGSENPNVGATPSDDLRDGTAGRRGVYVATDSPGAVKWAAELLRRDLDTDSHVDLRPFQVRDPKRGAPAPDYEPERAGGGAGYVPVFVRPLEVTAPHQLALITAPENSLERGAGLLGLLGRAGPGDRVDVEQLGEPVWWGDGGVDGEAALNPRVSAYVAAARRGARVRVLLDECFAEPDDPRGNYRTVAHVNWVAKHEGLDLEARLANPAGKGLHNKMVLVELAAQRIDIERHLWSVAGSGFGPSAARSVIGPAAATTRYWSHIGSLNGSEVSSKVNREAAVNIESAAVYQYLASVFAYDWASSGANALWLPRLDRR